MNAFCSFTGGVLVVPGSDGSPAQVHRLLDGPSWSEPEELHLLSEIDDWEPVEGDGAESLVTSCVSVCWTRQTKLLVIALLQGVSGDLEKEILVHLEETLTSRARPDDVLGELLVAPLLRRDDASRLARKSLASGCATAASLFDRLSDFQPLLHRFADSWLDLSPSTFTELARSPSEFWVRLARTGRFVKLLEAQHRREFINGWNLFAMEEETPAARQAVVDIGSHLSEAIFPNASETREPGAAPTNSRPRKSWSQPMRSIPPAGATR